MDYPDLVLAHDIGTTGNKTCLFSISDKIELIGSALVEYPLYMLDNGGAEQDPEDWWRAICESTKRVIKKTKVDPDHIKGMSFCTQMQGFVAVDKEGKSLRRAMSYMDNRATKQMKDSMGGGAVKIAELNATKVLKFLKITGAAPASSKDPVWKYLWVKDNEPHVYEQMDKWYDVKEYLIHRCTGRSAMTYDSAFATLMFDSRKGRFNWPKSLFDMLGVNINHMPPVIEATDLVGGLSEQAAKEMYLKPGIPVFGGGGDASMIPVGAGCTKVGDGHIYVGTSGWSSVVVDKRTIDITAMVASVLGAMPEKFNYFAEQETSGICLQWVRDHLALDEIGIFLKKEHVAEKQEEYSSLYEYLSKVVEETAPGAGGVIFTPWLRGNRCPFEDPDARAMFFNVGLDTGKRKLVRAVLEGVAYHKRWMIEAIEKKFDMGDAVRFVGGGANSPVWCQIMADVTGKKIEIVDNPQNAGAVGAAVVCAIGLGFMDSFSDVRSMVPTTKTYYPRKEYREMYDRQYKVFTTLYKNNKAAFKLLNSK